ncbi:MAG: division/cell wall cluster transcriptional repressor MraZ [Chlorobi bacterium]|jgi:MraZ protein|uniref:Transcriptional regulator MraZ n=2 Tax=Chryseobacterium TaxID=59732 RepID=A0AAJ1R4E8_9FLAO|nr:MULTISPECIES: division/cell wall cluster transcriptional repressor MraZ [Chryseobacterium]NPA07948.1 division/cell wall cluster transcriptional repressor MraZ [Chlorobiota bacterium]MCF2220896.1 division/cell wall cluster transcriptional repressor MraZ [Chryseobacterium sp. PS-8]MDN4012147.1 division/cell wall cluster transcriptional repressor MraZ [Chryseobacterium gambrini]MDN4029665.1 division/cell wall cluster transcriptional repressor MraZ [Chryseobacterium gambrini]QWA37091.1 division
MNSFIGTYECKIDDKGRLKVPSSLIKQMENFDDKAFVVKRSVFQPCLEVYPMNAWNKVMGKINKLNRFIKKNADFIRMFTAGVKIAELDNAGRLQISKDLTVFANLQKEIVITSAGELFEIWDKDDYEKVISISEDDFANLAEDVMGTFEEE